ncbi:MAG TPA: hypothetical protein VIF64_07350 [Pyrinomonadaceae bacterium]
MRSVFELATRYAAQGSAALPCDVRKWLCPSERNNLLQLDPELVLRDAAIDPFVQRRDCGVEVGAVGVAVRPALVQR